MGLLDRWLKKIKRTQLKQGQTAAAPLDVARGAALSRAERAAPLDVARGAALSRAERAAPEASSPRATEPPVPAAEPSISTATPLANQAQAFGYRVIIRPLVTEKGSSGEAAGKYAFVVARWATKPQVRAAMLALYGVNPRAVTVANIQGKRMRFGGNSGQRSDFKKAIVTLPAGKTIALHEGV